MPFERPTYHQGNHIPDSDRVLIAYSTSPQALPVLDILRQLQLEGYEPAWHADFAINKLKVAGFELQNRRLSVAQAIAFLQAQPLFKLKRITFERDQRLSMLQVAPDDLLYVQQRQWALDRIEAPAAWACVEGAAGGPRPVTVAVLDSGAQVNHQDLDAGSLTGIRAANGQRGDSDDDGHGTMVLGTIAAISGNGVGVAGVARYPLPAGTASYLSMMAIKINDVRNAPTVYFAGLGISLALAAGAEVINLSWHVLDPDSLLLPVIQQVQLDALFVMAAGNQGEDNNRRPGVHPASYANANPNVTPLNIISVMASNRHDQKPGFSDYGDNVHIAAPGTRIPTTGIYYVQARYPEYSGTSAAAPHVAGAAALLLASEGRLAAGMIWSPEMIRDRLIATADYVPALNGLCQANGRLNVRKAVCVQIQLHAPNPPLNRQAGTPIHVEWRLRYTSAVVKTVEIVIVDYANKQELVLTKDEEISVDNLICEATLPATAMNQVVIRIRCREKPILFADSVPFDILPADRASGASEA